MNQLISVYELINLYLYHNSDQKTSLEYTLKLQNQYKTTFFPHCYLCWAILTFCSSLSLRSDCVPTNRNGVLRAGKRLSKLIILETWNGYSPHTLSGRHSWDPFLFIQLPIMQIYAFMEEMNVHSSFIPYFGIWCLISGTHFSLTFSKEMGAMTLKQTRKTSVWG